MHTVLATKLIHYAAAVMKGAEILRSDGEIVFCIYSLDDMAEHFTI